MTSFIQTVPPATEPVTLADAKLHARIDTDADDDLVTGLIAAARAWAENYTGRAFITQTWVMWLDTSPGAVEHHWDGVRQGAVTGLERVAYVNLPRPPLASVTSIMFYDNTDTGTVWPASNYFVDTARAPGRVALRMGATWPIPARLTNGIGITYLAGYGSDASDVPAPIITAIKQLVAHWYENRGEASTAPTNRGAVITPSVPVPLVIQALLDPYRIRTGGV